MSEARSAEILIAPTSKVVETLRSAVLAVGLDEFLERAGVSGDVLERWLNGKEWVPVSVVREACEINRKHPEAPSYTKVLSECTSDAQFRIYAGETAEKIEMPVTEAAKRISAEISTGRPRKQKSTPVRHEMSAQVAKVALALFFVPILGAAIGYWLWNVWGAVAGAILSYVGVALLIFVSLVLSAKKPRAA